MSNEFTLETLADYDGLNGHPAYVAFSGKVYDVTESPLWKNGIHKNRHHAGSDLTDALARAPHGAYILQKFPVVGVMKPENK